MQERATEVHVISPAFQFAAIVFGPDKTFDRYSVTSLHEAPREILKLPLEIFSVSAPEVEGQVKRNLIDLRVKLHASTYSFFLAQSWTTSQPSVVSAVRASPRENTESTRSKSSPRSISPTLRPRVLLEGEQKESVVRGSGRTSLLCFGKEKKKNFRDALRSNAAAYYKNNKIWKAIFR